MANSFEHFFLEIVLNIASKKNKNLNLYYYIKEYDEKNNIGIHAFKDEDIINIKDVSKNNNWMELSVIEVNTNQEEILISHESISNNKVYQFLIENKDMVQNKLNSISDETRKAEAITKLKKIEECIEKGIGIELYTIALSIVNIFNRLIITDKKYTSITVQKLRNLYVSKDNLIEIIGSKILSEILKEEDKFAENTHLKLNEFIKNYISYFDNNYITAFRSLLYLDEMIIQEQGLLGTFNINHHEGMGTLQNVAYIPINILLKGVPGTGKSRYIDIIIEKHLKIGKEFIPKQVLRLNIHASTANADLMNGIGITTFKGQIIYREKQGIVLNHIINAIRNPNIPYVLVFEEIQENSLNELIGDLIYLIEKDKRVDLSFLTEENISKLGKQDIFVQVEQILKMDNILKEGHNSKQVSIPFLIESKTSYRKIILPSNLYFFCTTNYRDDKKILDDNLFRRFEVIDIFPEYNNVIKNNSVKEFLEKFNNQVLVEFMNDYNPDRYLTGHSNWINVVNSMEFYRSFLKLINEYKEIKEVDFARLKIIFKNINKIKINLDDAQGICIGDLTVYESYSDIIKDLLGKCDYKFLENINIYNVTYKSER